ncbi:hypothetical protein F5146DRAFT_1002227 [Armillaria mellea]|nr:hypothetical protein F5146DRAFT_1002227 [Armillaria mellea]
MAKALPSMDSDGIQLYDKVDRDDKDVANIYDGYCIEQGYIRGLDKEDSIGELQSGTLTVEDLEGKNHLLHITTTHQHIIPEGSYMLIGSDPWLQKSAESKDKSSKQYWVVDLRTLNSHLRIQVNMSDNADKSPCTVDGSSIEAICPIDSCGLPIPDISDREINAILVKGRQYESASVQKRRRGNGSKSGLTLGSNLLVARAIESHLFLIAAILVSTPDISQNLTCMLHAANGSCDMSSHVILTACKEYQTAKEVESEAEIQEGCLSGTD